MESYDEGMWLIQTIRSERVTKELLRIHESSFCREDGDDSEYGIRFSGLDPLCT